METSEGIRFQNRKIRELNSSKKKIEENIEYVSRMSSVYDVDQSKLEKTGKRPSDTFAEQFESWGNYLYSEELGHISVEKSSVKSEVRHGITAEKIASIEAIPSVIEKGKVIFVGQKSESGLLRIVVGAPITIAEKPYYMGIMLQRDARFQRLYLHNVAIVKEASEISQDDLLTTGAHENNENLSMTSILQNALAVKYKNEIIFGKGKDSGDFVYSFNAEKESSTRQTLHADVNTRKGANGELFLDDSISQSDSTVNSQDTQNSKKYSARRKVASDEKTSTRDYSYNALVGKPDMVVTVLDEDVPTNRADIVLQAKKNAASIGKTDKNGSVSVRVDDIGVDVVLSTGGLRHSLDRRFDVNAPVTLKAGEILHHSIKINEMIPENPNADSSYVLIGIAQNTKGELYVVRSVVNKFRSELVSMDVLYAINAKTEPNLGIKKNQAGAYPQGITEKSAILTGSADMAVLDAPRYTESPLSVTNPKISIAQLLEYVNRYFPDVLPESVLRHFGHTERPQGKIGESALFSTRREGTSDRALLEGVDESEIADRDVLSELREYKETLAALDAEEEHLRELLKHGLPRVSRVSRSFFPDLVLAGFTFQNRDNIP